MRITLPFASDRYREIRNATLLLVLAALFGCQRSIAIPRAENWQQRATRLLPLAETAVANWAGHSVHLELMFVDQCPSGIGIAQRDGDTLMMTAAAAVTEQECYDTLCHELVHRAINAPTIFQEDKDIAVIRLMIATNEAIAWKTAAELTGHHFHSEPRYDFTHLPQSELQRELIVHAVFKWPEGMIQVARDYDTAQRFLDGVRRGAAE